MIRRCYNDHCAEYPRYGGRGIWVCERWHWPGGFENFLADLGEKPPGVWIERIDNDSGYVCGRCDDCVARGITKTNCCWATPLEQGRNRSNVRFIEANGERLHISEWSRRLGTKIVTICARLRLGWTPEAAVTTPVAKRARTRAREASPPYEILGIPPTNV
jgi:hypothetical protein